MPRSGEFKVFFSHLKQFSRQITAPPAHRRQLLRKLCFGGYKNIETPKDLGNVRARIISGCRKNRKIEIEFKKFWGFWHPLRLRSNNDMHTLFTLRLLPVVLKSEREPVS